LESSKLGVDSPAMATLLQRQERVMPGIAGAHAAENITTAADAVPNSQEQ